MAKRKAQVYITPAGKGEYKTPIPFDLSSYGEEQVRGYAKACARKGQTARIVWPGGKEEKHEPAGG